MLLTNNDSIIIAIVEKTTKLMTENRQEIENNLETEFSLSRQNMKRKVKQNCVLCPSQAGKEKM